jgi:hypothetical protein
MSQKSINTDLASDWKGLCKIGGVTALTQLICVISTLTVVLTLGGEPATAEEYFTLLQNDRLIGILRMDFTSMISVALYPLTCFGLYAALRKTKEAYAALAVALSFVGVILWLGSHSALSMLSLSDQYATATTETQQTQLITAGQAIIAADMWHSTGAFMGGIFMQGGLVILSILMLQGQVFSKATAIVGILTHGFDFAHILIGIFVPGIGFGLMWIAGPLYPVWFILIAKNLFHLGNK